MRSSWRLYACALIVGSFLGSAQAETFSKEEAARFKAQPEGLQLMFLETVDKVKKLARREKRLAELFTPEEMAVFKALPGSEQGALLHMLDLIATPSGTRAGTR